MTTEKLKKEIKKEFIFDRTTKILLALASIDYYGDEDLRKWCVDYSRDIIASLLDAKKIKPD